MPRQKHGVGTIRYMLRDRLIYPTKEAKLTA